MRNVYITRCACGNMTQKSYARKHNGKCKKCVTGEPRKWLRCPDCGRNTLTPYQKAHGYHCDGCTRNVEETGGIYGY